MSTTETPITPIDRAEIVNGNVIVAYSATEAALADMRNRFHNVVFDLTTTKGDKEARAARQDLLKLRTSLEAKRKEFKAPALALGKKIDAEAERITSEIKAVEDPIDQQIKADEARRAAEKAERERIEAARVDAHQKRLAAIRACVSRAQDLPSERIANGIAQVEAIDVSPSIWQEFVDAAVTARAETLDAMRALFASAKAREDEAARVEAQRLENERVAEENRKLAAHMAEQQRQLAAQAAAVAANQPKADPIVDPVVAPAPAPAIAITADEPTAVVATLQAAVVPISTQAPLLTESPPCAGHATPVGEKPTLKLGEINARLGFTVTAEFLASLGYDATVDRASKLYREGDFPAICNAISAHTTGVRDQHAYKPRELAAA